MIARTILEARIGEVREALRRARLMRHLAVVFALGIFVRGSFLLAALKGHHVSKSVDRWSMLCLIILAVIAYFKGRRNLWSDRDIARLIEQRHPALDSVLLTAIDHEPQADEPSGYLHERLIDHALARAATQDWPVSVADKPYRRALAVAWVAVVAFLATDIALRFNGPEKKGQSAVAAKKDATLSAPTTFQATLTPGDVELERGSRLIVEARFNGPVPADATLVISEPEGKERERVVMRLTVDQQVFGGLINKVDRDAKYHVEFAEQKSPQHTITVFDFPKLVRSDVIVTPPAYSGLPAKETKNTQKVTALEGATIQWKIKVNKTLKVSEFFGEDKSIVELKPSATDPTLLEATMLAVKSQKYRLHLVDDRDQANKNPPWFTVTVQSNQLAKIEVVFPKRDVQVSAIQELPVEAKVSDDLGVIKSGAVFNINGDAKEILFNHPATGPQKKQDVRAELALENESAQPRQLVSYYLWAEDTGPKGEVRRSMSDMFFADVRHFEDIFREAEAPPPDPGKKAKSDGLVELQKQVVNATWRIVRDTNGGKPMETAAPDVDVVHESQNITMEKVKEAMEEVDDGEVKTALTEAWKSMKDVLEPLEQASADKKRSPLTQALTFEQTALEWLHRAQSREHQVMRGESTSGASQSEKNQIMDLELKQKEQRYEEEKVATAEQTAEQQENLQVLNRLKELARRQEALAEKVKELQNQLANAKTEEEKQELENQLQRLQAEQEQLLRDVDDLKERMEKPENAQNMAEAKEQLDQTREQIMQAAEDLKNKELTDAANAATRAQRELEKMQEDFRQKTSRKFADEMKQLRDQAREAAESQKKISEAIENQKSPDEAGKDEGVKDLEKALNNGQLGRQVTEQQEHIEKLLNSMRELSEQAEQSEPMLHRNLYDAVRKAQTSGLEENLQETREQLRYGTPADAKEAERKAANSVTELQKGVEKAAESVLGSETETLRVAKSELDKLIKDSQEQSGQPGDPKGQDPKLAENGQKPGEGQQPSDKEGEGKGKGEPQDPKVAENGQQSGKDGQGQKPGEGQKPGQDGQGQQPGEQGKDGQQPGKGEGKGQQPGAQASSQQPGSDKPGESPAGQGQQPGEGEGKGEAKGKGQGMQQTAEAGNQPGQGQGQGQQPGGKGSSQQQANANSPNGQGQEGADQPRDGQPRTGTPQRGTERDGNDNNQTIAGGPTGGKDSENDRFRPRINGGAVPEALFFEDSSEQEDRRVFTGNGYEQWSDRLRNVEELLNNPELRNEAAKIFDRAREMRIGIRRSNEAPQVANLNTRITQPLIELRDRVIEELSKRDAGKNLAPVDRDPVPAEFRELVKRYYQELGAGK